MTTNNGLIPEHRTDKNGRSVLRHVRPQQAVTESAVLAATVPSVAAPVPYEMFNDNFRLFWDRQDISDTHYSDEDFDQRAVKSLNRIFSPESEHEPFGLMQALSQGFNEMMGAGEETEGRTSIHNIAAFADDLHHLRNVRSYIDGLHRTVGHTKDYLTDADDEERAQAVSIMKLTDAIAERSYNWDDVLKSGPEKWGNYVSMRDKRMVALAMDCASRIDDLLELIEDDAPVPDADTLRAMLQHEQKALAKGVL